MSHYKDTLNLPQTTFPMKANLAQREPARLRFWDELDLYTRIRKQSEGRPRFILHDGPPYANGPIHLGTALNKILKDIILKFKTLQGFDTPYIPGWDCHGLPIELQVEKQTGHLRAAASDQPLSDFRQACYRFALSQVEQQREDFKRLGVLADWQHPYLTLQPAYEAQVIRALATLFERGYLSYGKKPVHWCIHCASALAEAEVEYCEKTALAIDVAFNALDLKAVFDAFSVPPTSAIDTITFPIWTTTTWTLPANEAVAVHTELMYVLVLFEEQGDTDPIWMPLLKQRLWVLAKDLLPEVVSRYGISAYQVLAETQGQALEHLQLSHPYLEDRSVPVILADHVSTAAGTGNVHTAPAHGQEDYVAAERYHLPIHSPVDASGCFIATTPLVAGLSTAKASDVIVKKLAEVGRLIHSAKIMHSYPHCWRHRSPVLFRATAQWFITMDKSHLRQHSLQAVDEVCWMPGWGRERLQQMLVSRPDWCISRQRYWGIPIPLFLHKTTQALHPHSLAIMRRVADQIEKEGVTAWFDRDAADWIGEAAKDYEPVQDVLDVWFDSGVTHACVLEPSPQLSLPADLYLEGSDQYRGWFQTALLTAVAMRHAPPYKAVFTHGYVVDGQGRKMSKSVGNVVSPNAIVKRYGADLLRLWVASSDCTEDIHFSDEIMQRVTDMYRRIRNTARFLLANLHDFDAEKNVIPVAECLALDVWAIQTARTLQQRLSEAYESYRFSAVCQMIHHFCAIDMGSFYLDLIKDRLYTGQTEGRPRRSAQTAMYFILKPLVRWLAPILSFTAEEIWQCMLETEDQPSVFLSTWMTDFPEGCARTAELDWVRLRQLRDVVNKALEEQRAAGIIGSSLDAAVRIRANPQDYAQLSMLNSELRFFLIVSEAEVLALPAGSDALSIEVTPSRHEKCERCWQRCPDLQPDEPRRGLCARCIANVWGEGEPGRQYV